MEYEGTPPPVFCVKAVDKGVRWRFGVKAVDKGLSRQRVDSERWVVSSLSALALRDWLQEFTDCENTPGCGEKEGRDGDTVSRTLSYIYRIRYYLSSEK
jgi:hypothetical protein